MVVCFLVLQSFLTGIAAVVNIRFSMAFTIATTGRHHVHYNCWNNSTNGQAGCGIVNHVVNIWREKHPVGGQSLVTIARFCGSRKVKARTSLANAMPNVIPR